MLSHLNYILWNPDVEAFHLFGFSVRWYSLCWLIGLVLAYFIVQRLYKQQKMWYTSEVRLRRGVRVVEGA
mgnify:CR=1 FL=1